MKYAFPKLPAVPKLPVGTRNWPDPDDSRPLLAFSDCDDGDHFSGWYVVDYNPSIKDSPWQIIDNHGNLLGALPNVTHWMHLPANPEITMDDDMLEWLEKLDEKLTKLVAFVRAMAIDLSSKEIINLTEIGKLQADQERKIRAKASEAALDKSP